MAPEPMPSPKPAKNRLFQDGRDMFWSIAPLILVCVLLAGVLGRCSFAPAGPGEAPPPDFDAAATLQADAEVLPFPIRLPQLPEGWAANAGRRGGLDGGRTDPVSGQPLRSVSSTVGYLSPTGRYLSLTQTDADEATYLQSLPRDRSPSGSRDVAGVTWVIYEGAQDTEPVWTTRVSSPRGPAQLVLTGAATPAEFTTMAAAVASQPPLPARR